MRATTERLPRVVISCFEVPCCGGAATGAYKLFDYLRRDEYDVSYVNLIRHDAASRFREIFGPSVGNPQGLACVHSVVLEPGMFDPQPALDRLLEKLDPDTMLGVDYVAALLMKRARPSAPLVFHTGGCEQVRRHAALEPTSTVTELMTGPVERIRVRHLEEAEAVERADVIVTHSDLVRRLYWRYFPGARQKIHHEVLWKAGWICRGVREAGVRPLAFHDRDIDVVFAASTWSRAEKNLPLVKELVSRLDDLDVHVLGELDEPLPGATCTGFVADRRAALEPFARSRVLVCPSSFDPAPGILYEAATLGCNVVASKNCGNWEICHDELLADPFDADVFETRIRRATRRRFESNLNRFLRADAYRSIIELVHAVAERVRHE